MASTSDSEKHNTEKNGKETNVKVEGKATSKPQSKFKKKKPLHPVEELFGESLMNAEGNTISPKCFVQNDGVIGLYFAANWCPPCRVITPMLVDMYKAVKDAEKQLEIVFISFDHTQTSFKEYLSKMPWWAVDYDKTEKKEEIAFKYGIRGIPILMFLDAKTLEINTKNGRDLVLNDPKGALFPWKNLPDPLHIECSPTPTPSQTDEKSTTASQKEEEGLKTEESVKEATMEADAPSDSPNSPEDQPAASTEDAEQKGSGHAESDGATTEGQGQEDESLTSATQLTQSKEP